VNKTKEKIKTDSGKAEDIYGETERGCGWRHIGGFYLMGSGMGQGCDALPLDLEPCGECGFELPKKLRVMMSVHSGYLRPKILVKHSLPKDSEKVGEKCSDKFPCPVCNMKFGKKFLLMTVAKEFYSPESFIEEARKYGVSKRIRPETLPKEFELGKTWVFLAHKEAIRTKDSNPDILTDERKLGEYKRGLFYAFKPKRIEAIVGDNEKPEKVKDLEDEGFKVIQLPHDDPRFQPTTRKEKTKE
jgi:hypothetical protein